MLRCESVGKRFDQCVSLAAQAQVAHRVQDVLFLHVVLLHHDQEGFGLAGEVVGVLLVEGVLEGGQGVAQPEVLLAAVAEAGLNVDQARAMLNSDEFAEEVREREGFYTSHGIHSVPAVVVNNRHLISGGQPVEVYERALREIVVQQ